MTNDQFEDLISTPASRRLQAELERAARDSPPLPPLPRKRQPWLNVKLRVRLSIGGGRRVR